MGMDMQCGHDLLNGLGRTAWTWKCSIDLDMQHGLGHDAVYMFVPMSVFQVRYGNGQQMDIRHEQWTCIMDMDMQQGHTSWT